MKAYFVTGTDTGVGKTHVSCALAHHARDAGKRVFAFKPIETGCNRVDDELVGSDQQRLVQAAGNWQTGPLAGLYQFALAAAPLVAAETEQRPIDPSLILRTCNQGTRGMDLVLVEGAGGWRVPITRTLDMGGLARMLGFPVIIVARATLGTINHTLLTIEAVERDHQEISHVVVSRRPADDEATCAISIEQIRRRWSGPLAIVEPALAALV